MTISLDTWLKKVAETAACMGFANAYARSRETSVGPLSTSADEGSNETWAPPRTDDVRCEDSNRHVVTRVLNSGVDEEAIAWKSNCQIDSK